MCGDPSLGRPITQTIQEGSEYHMPWMYSHKPGQRFVVEHKRAGRIVRTDVWVLISFRHDDGELVYRWDRLGDC